MGSIKKNVRSGEKRILRATVLALAAANGHGDGETYADCVACGTPAFVGRHASDPDALELGHDVAEANGGFFECRNLHALCAACNDTMATRNLRECLTPRYDIWKGWNGVKAKDPGPAPRRAIDRESLWIPVK